MRKPIQLVCRICGKEFETTDFLSLGSISDRNGRLVGTCNMVPDTAKRDGRVPHPVEDIKRTWNNPSEWIWNKS